MKIKRMTWILLAVVLAMIMVVGCASWFQKPEARSVREHISIDARDDVYLYNGASLYIYSDGHSTTKFSVAGTSGNTTIAGTAAITGKATFSAPVVFASTNVTPTNGSTLTVAASMYKVHSTAAVTITLGTTGAMAGQIVSLYGDDGYNVIIADTNIRTTTGNALTIGQYDIAVFQFNGTDWIEWLLATDS